MAEISARPADKPSRPSTRLKAFVTPMIQSTDSGNARKPMAMVRPNRCTSGFSEIPSQTAIEAPSACARNLGAAGSVLMSSSTEMARIGSSPSASPGHTLWTFGQSSAEDRTNSTPMTLTTAVMTAMPPSLDTGRW